MNEYELFDPVCGMKLTKNDSEFDKYSSNYKDKTYHFCSSFCLEIFSNNPEYFIKTIEKHYHKREDEIND